MINVDHDLITYLSRSENSRTREALLQHRLVHELMTAAARRNYPLQVFTAEVDRDGHDVVFDDGRQVKKFQLKSVALEATRSWEIHSELVRPEMAWVEILDLRPEPTDTGVGGGVILQRISERRGELSVDYSYTDMFVLRAIQWRCIKPRGSDPAGRIKAVVQELRRDPVHHKTRLPERAFLKIKSAEHLLAVMGLISRIDFELEGLFRARYEERERGTLNEARWRRLVGAELRKVADEPV